MALEIEHFGWVAGTFYLEKHGAIVEQAVALHGGYALMNRIHFQDIAIPLSFTPEGVVLVLDRCSVARVGVEAGGDGAIWVVQGKGTRNIDVSFAVIDSHATGFDGPLAV